MSTIALIPAHNESATIRQAVLSIKAQQPDRIIVVCDNCTDDTDEVALAAGAEVFASVNNTAKKAGALNQALARILPTLNDQDSVFVQDADSIIDPGFLDIARTFLDEDRSLGGVGGTFRGGPGGGLVGMFQRNEYARYARDVDRLRGGVLVLTGTATLFRVRALRDVLLARSGGLIPQGNGVYDETVLTEDNEISQALMHIGWKILSPKGCTLETEIMPTWRELYRQRLRWKRGAIENLFQYGWTRVTRPYWGRQALTALGCFVTALYLSTVLLSVLYTGGILLSPFWLLVTLAFSLERVVTVRKRGWRQMIVGAMIILEFPYDVFLQGIHVVAYIQSAFKVRRSW